jgi:hypothetical protein
MKRLLGLTLVFVMVLAGCSSFPVGPTETPEQTATSTPTPAETVTPTPTESTELAPGVTENGLVNPVALIRAHQMRLLEEGYVLNQTVVTTYNGSESNRLVVESVAGPGGEVGHQNGTSSAIDADGNETVTRNELWLNTTTMVTRHIEAGQTTYQVRPRSYPPEALIWFGGLQMQIQLGGDRYVVDSVETRDGVRVVTLTASIDRVGGDGVNDTVSTLAVDETGVIRNAVVDVTYEEGTNYRTNYTIEQLGVEAPDPPAWLDTVPPSAALDIGLDVFEFDDQSIQLVHTHGDAVPEGSTVTVVSNGTTYLTTLGEPFADGERYLWVGTDGSLRATADRPADGSTRTLDTEVTVVVRAPDGGELFSTSIGRFG